jgi:hypothetical protein
MRVSCLPSCCHDEQKALRPNFAISQFRNFAISQFRNYVVSRRRAAQGAVLYDIDYVKWLQHNIASYSGRGAASSTRDPCLTETGSFNFSQAAARSNSELDLVVWNDERVAARYVAHWNSRWVKGIEVEIE